jgi:hypothetical protein
MPLGIPIKIRVARYLFPQLHQGRIEILGFLSLIHKQSLFTKPVKSLGGIRVALQLFCVEFFTSMMKSRNYIIQRIPYHPYDAGNELLRIRIDTMFKITPTLLFKFMHRGVLTTTIKTCISTMSLGQHIRVHVGGMNGIFEEPIRTPAGRIIINPGMDSILGFVDIIRSHCVVSTCSHSV